MLVMDSLIGAELAGEGRIKVSAPVHIPQAGFEEHLQFRRIPSRHSVLIVERQALSPLFLLGTLLAHCNKRQAHGAWTTSN